ncbi:MAG: polysaccharide deacetylase family protein [Bdellovibrio sp.]|nr:polysaccharide deacetylase family protein [Bdellovibrio sp.]
MKKSTLAFCSALATLALTVACTQTPVNKNVEPRLPAAETPLEKADVDQIKDMVLSKKSASLIQKFLVMRIAQTAVSSFDVRLESFKTEKEIDALNTSRLYCKLMDVRAAHDKNEEEILYTLTLAKSMGAEYENWFYQQMSAFANQHPANEAAMGHVFVGLSNEAVQICGSEYCVSADLNKLTGFHMNPLDSKGFNRFMKANKKAISLVGYEQTSATNLKNDLAPGDCFSENSKRKPQAEGYDWVNRNWVGSVLPAGQFIFTYDDGPHATYTRIIRDTWAEAGMAKPAFFWLRKNASNLSSIVSELNGQGYIIGSHSERHADLGNLAKSTSPADFNGVNRQMFSVETKGLTGSAYNTWKSNTLDREINQSVKDLSAILGKPVRYFRLPYGSGVRNDLIGARFQALNLDHFFWRVDSLDWQDKNPESIRDRVVAQMQAVKKGIILFHDIHPQSAQAAKLMVQYLKANPSYKAVSISDLPGLKP